MSKMPKNLPDITIHHTGEADSAFWTELMGWFIIPRIGEKASWAIYDYPARTRSEAYDLNCIRPTRIHGVEGVEIEMQETLADGTQPPFSLVAAQLTDTHCRYLAETTIVDGVRDVCTFLDDAFTARLAIGEDNCGTEIHLVRKDAIIPAENGYACSETKPVFDVTGRFEVTVGTRTFETVRITYIETDADGTILCEYYVDANGRCVLDRRFNADDWKISYYKKKLARKAAGKRGDLRQRRALRALVQLHFGLRAVKSRFPAQKREGLFRPSLLLIFCRIWAEFFSCLRSPRGGPPAGR